MTLRRPVLPILLASLVAALAAAPAATAATPACTSSDLVVWLDTAGDGAAGSVFFHLRFTNLSARACHLIGFPGVSAVDRRGHRLGVPAARDRSVPRAKSVRIARGATAGAVLQIVQARNFPSATCGPTTAAGLRVYPPNQRRSKLIPFPFDACTKKGPVFLRVRPVRAP